MQRQFADAIETQQNVTVKNKDQIVRLLRPRLHAGVADFRISEGLLCLVIIRIRSQHTGDCSEHRSELKSHILPEVFSFAGFSAGVSRFIFVSTTPFQPDEVRLSIRVSALTTRGNN